MNSRAVGGKRLVVRAAFDDFAPRRRVCYSRSHARRQLPNTAVSQTETGNKCRQFDNRAVRQLQIFQLAFVVVPVLDGDAVGEGVKLRRRRYRAVVCAFDADFQMAVALVKNQIRQQNAAAQGKSVVAAVIAVFIRRDIADFVAPVAAVKQIPIVAEAAL